MIMIIITQIKLYATGGRPPQYAHVYSICRAVVTGRISNTPQRKYTGPFFGTEEVTSNRATLSRGNEADWPHATECTRCNLIFLLVAECFAPRHSQTAPVSMAPALGSISASLTRPA